MGDTSCYGRGGKAVYAHAARVSETLVMNAAKHLGANVCAAHEDTGYIDDADGVDNPNEVRLRALVTAALANSEKERVGSISRALLHENMTVKILHDACAAGGSMLLFAALDIDGLTRADRLCLVNAVSEDARQRDK